MADKKVAQRIEEEDITAIPSDDADESQIYDALNLDKEEVEKLAKIPIIKDKDITDKVLKVNQIANSYKFVLEGKELSNDGDYYVQTGKSIATGIYIRLSYSLINSFSEGANLVSNKDDVTFKIQFVDNFVKANDYILVDKGISAGVSKMCIKLFKDKLFNVGEIICGNKENMRAIFGIQDQTKIVDNYYNPLQTNPSRNPNMQFNPNNRQNGGGF